MVGSSWCILEVYFQPEITVAVYRITTVYIFLTTYEYIKQIFQKFNSYNFNCMHEPAIFISIENYVPTTLVSWSKNLFSSVERGSASFALSCLQKHFK